MDPNPQSRPLGGTELTWSRALPGGTGLTVLAFLLSPPLPDSLLLSALHSLLDSHPILRSTVVGSTITTDPTLQPNLVHLSATDILALHPSSTPFHALLEHELSRPADGGAVFSAAVYDIETEPGSSSGPVRSFVALRLQTGFCDRTSGVAVLRDLLAIVRGEGGVLREDGVGPAVEDLIPKKDTWKPLWARGKDLVGYSLNTFRTAGLGFVDAGSERSSEVVRLVMGVPETGRLLAACEEKGIKFCGALLAAGLIAAYKSKNLENHQSENYSVITLIDCRKYLDPVLTDHHVGFYHSAVLNTHSIKGGEGLWEVAIRCHDAYSTAMSNKKHLTDIGDLNFLMCKAIDNPHLTPSSSLRTALLSVFEEPVFYETSESQKTLGVEDYIGCATVHGIGPSIAIFDTIRDGQLDCACVYPSPLHSRKQIQELVECMKGILVEGSRAGRNMED